MDFIYILSAQRGQRSPEIFSIWDSYEKAIIAYHQYHIKDGYGKQENSELYFMNLYKFPVNEKFAPDDTWSEVKLQKSSKYRLKMDWKKLKEEFAVANRNSKLTDILNEKAL